ncbi:MAG: hypothetical protein U9N87_06300 [Planctomycetota bacterium]|nr:hypothetical protein [Planctomycetota bacterium]
MSGELLLRWRKALVGTLHVGSGRQVARQFRQWLKHRRPPPGEILFPITERSSGVSRRTAKMMRDDLAAARRAWIKEVDDAKEQECRENSDFLKYQDSGGRFAFLRSLVLAAPKHPICF